MYDYTVLFVVQIADSFPNDSFGQSVSQQETASAENQHSVVILKKPPKWLRRPCGASFGVILIYILMEQSILCWLQLVELSHI